MFKPLPALLAAVAAALAMLTAGCEVDSSSDEFIRDVSIDFTGYYTHPTSDRIVSRNSGSAITSLDLRQDGDQLEAIDNNGSIWRGSLGDVNGGSSSFELEGTTTSGDAGFFSGTLSSSDGGTSTSGTTSSAEGTMTGTYIENDFFSTFYAQADIPGTTDDGGDGGDDGETNSTAFSVSPSSATISADGSTQLFSASGGSGSYSWSISDSTVGTLSASSGSSVTYTRNTSGNNTLTVSDGTDSTSISITQE